MPLLPRFCSLCGTAMYEAAQTTFDPSTGEPIVHRLWQCGLNQKRRSWEEQLSWGQMRRHHGFMPIGSGDVVPDSLPGQKVPTAGFGCGCAIPIALLAVAALRLSARSIGL